VTLAQLPAAAALLVAVIVDGTLVPSAPPAMLSDGRVMAPLDVVARLADAVEDAGGAIVARRGGRACRAPTAVVGGQPVVALAPLARCLGAQHIAWDGVTKTLAVVVDGPLTVRTMAPFDPAAPRAAPTIVFTPEPAPPTPRVISTGSPRPRRTAIPMFAPPPGVSTTPRPKAL